MSWHACFSAWLIPTSFLLLLPPSGLDPLLVHTVPQMDLEVARRVLRPRCVYPTRAVVAFDPRQELVLDILRLAPCILARPDRSRRLPVHRRILHRRLKRVLRVLLLHFRKRLVEPRRRWRWLGRPVSRRPTLLGRHSLVDRALEGASPRPRHPPDIAICWRSGSWRDSRAVECWLASACGASF